jgi:hypothetical protein
LATNNSDPAPSPIAIGMVRKISVHLILLKNAEKKTGSAKMVRKLSKPTKDGAVAPSQSQKAIAIVSRPGIRMIAALIISAGNKNGTAELAKRTANRSAFARFLRRIRAVCINYGGQAANAHE